MDQTVEKFKERLKERGFSDSKLLESLEVKGKNREFIIYRLGLNGQESHTYEETAEHFSISVERAKQLERQIFRSAFHCHHDSKRLKKYLES